MPAIWLKSDACQPQRYDSIALSMLDFGVPPRIESSGRHVTTPKALPIQKSSTPPVQGSYLDCIVCIVGKPNPKKRTSRDNSATTVPRAWVGIQRQAWFAVFGRT